MTLDRAASQTLCYASPRGVSEPPQRDLTVALRIFADRDGQQWRVWTVRPTAGSAAVRPPFQDGWLCFERLDGSCRCRLSAESAQEDWDTLSDDRLDLLRRVAVSA